MLVLEQCEGESESKTSFISLRRLSLSLSPSLDSLDARLPV